MDSYGRDQNRNQVVLYEANLNSNTAIANCWRAAYNKYRDNLAAVEIYNYRYCVAFFGVDVSRAGGDTR